jgi:hypothetical protein
MDEARLLDKLAKIEALFHGQPAPESASPQAKPAGAYSNDSPMSVRSIRRSSSSFHCPTLGRVASFWHFADGTISHPIGVAASATRRSCSPRPHVLSTRRSGPSSRSSAKPLRGYLEEVTERVVAQVLEADSSDAAEAEEPRQVELGALVAEQPPRQSQTRDES